MNQKALKTLEYNKIKNILKNFAVSQMGKTEIDGLEPQTDVVLVQQMLDETSESLSLLERFGSPVIYEINDITVHLRHVQKGGYMIPKYLLDCLNLLKGCESIRNYFAITEENEKMYPYLSNLIRNIQPFPRILREIETAIINENEIADHASKNLSRIRREKISKSNAIREKLSGIIKSDHYRTLLQDAIITEREGRFVVPVKSQNKGIFDGIVHDRSQSGQTVYIEPMAIVNLNNEIRVLEAEEEEEIIRILTHLSGLVGEVSEEMMINQQSMTVLDTIFAKAKYAIEIRATKPILSHQKSFHLRNARHPLIDQDKIVPIDVYLGEDYNTLIITGPNTGGKTVTLKTVGLMTLMAQTGLHIPCDEQSVVSIFEQIYTDIGDEQSIEQSLSTFSAHMTNIVEILKQVNENDLVLLDELGAGTDPTEGAALAIAILQDLLLGDIRTIATTHYSQLKLFALTTKGVKNGAVEFDVNTLSPTYKLTIGLPGKSNAFEISKRLGLESTIIDRAKETIEKENRDFEDILQEIDKNRQILEDQRNRQEQLKNELLELRKRYESEIAKTQRQRIEILDDANQRAKEIYDKAKEESKDLLKELKFMRREDIAKRANEIEDIFSEKTATQQTSLLHTTTKKETIQVGDEVEILGTGQIGTVLATPNKKGEVQLQLGIMKMNANVKNLKRTKSQESQAITKGTKNIIRNKKNQNIKSELDVRGHNVEEAMMEIDKYIDDCMVVGLKNLSIIHGKGTGQLRKGLRRFFEKDGRIKDIRDGTFQEGGLGVTVLKLK